MFSFLWMTDEMTGKDTDRNILVYLISYISYMYTVYVYNMFSQLRRANYISIDVSPFLMVLSLEIFIKKYIFIFIFASAKCCSHACFIPFFHSAKFSFEAKFDIFLFDSPTWDTSSIITDNLKWRYLTFERQFLPLVYSTLWEIKTVIVEKDI